MNAAGAPQGTGDRSAASRRGCRDSDRGRATYRLTPRAGWLELAVDERHVADLVRLVLLTGAGERLHRPDFGAGLGRPRCSSRSTWRVSSVDRDARSAARSTRRSATAIEVLDRRGRRASASRRSRPTLTYRLRPAGDAATAARCASVSDPSTLEPTCPPLHRPEALFAAGATVQGCAPRRCGSSGGSLFLDVWLYQDPPAALAHAAACGRSTARRRREPGRDRRRRSTIAGRARRRTSSSRSTARPTRRSTGSRSSTARRSTSTRCAPSCRCGCAPTATRSARASRCRRRRRRRRPRPVHDYLARDWRSLRQALLEYLLREHPDADLSIADPTVTVLELFAHVGDLLHYRLDRVATEAYLETARLRTSVRRHARLVDYQLGEAVSARTFVHVAVAADGRQRRGRGRRRRRRRGRLDARLHRSTRR